ncbi:hypothetical protein BGZ54_002045 [Gamsiella multidivaricata]|nr:hypothetical protein BGZ54_002045 [Gamsiella multidivaricata]
MDVDYDAWEPLKDFQLYSFILQPEKWKTVVKTIEFSALDTLGLWNTNFSAEELKILVDYILEGVSGAPLKRPDLKETPLSRHYTLTELNFERRAYSFILDQRALYVPHSEAAHRALPKVFKRRGKMLESFSVCTSSVNAVLTPMSERNLISNRTHLVKHEEYYLDRLNEFFGKYGPYPLALMQMIECGITVDDLIVPPLAHLKAVESQNDTFPHYNDS